jgi:hypothetical protein
VTRIARRPGEGNAVVEPGVVMPAIIGVRRAASSHNLAVNRSLAIRTMVTAWLVDR